MSLDEWEARYWAEACVHGREPAKVLVDCMPMLTAGRALDVAMGEGRNAIYLAEHGFHVTGMDRSETAVQRAREWADKWRLQLDARVADLEEVALPKAEYDTIVVTNYLQRSLFAPLAEALKPGGTLLYETYMAEHARYKPDMNPAYLLEPNELLRAFRDLRVIYYRESDDSEQERATAALVARRY